MGWVVGAEAVHVRRAVGSIVALAVCLGGGRAVAGRPDTPPPAAAPRAAWRVTRTLAREVVAHLDVTCPTSGGATVNVIAPIPPDLPSQALHEATFDPDARSVPDANEPTRALFVAAWRPPARSKATTFVARWRARLGLYARHLVPLAAGDTPDVVAPLTAAEWRRATDTGGAFDLRGAGVDAWLAARHLRRDRDEPDVEYARRAFAAVRQGITYAYPPASVERRAAQVCGDGASDCGGLNTLYVALLRAQGIPARLLVGRWAESMKPDAALGGRPFHQWHVRAEFYAAGVGWVPADAGTSAPVTDEALAASFGHDDGTFITLHVDRGVRVDVPGVGPQTVTWLQGMHALPLPAGYDLYGDGERWDVYEKR
jgi:transglutaminase-like putative cysteine protease